MQSQVAIFTDFRLFLENRTNQLDQANPYRGGS